MIEVRYFASLRESLGRGGETLEVEGLGDVASLLERLRLRGGVWQEALGEDRPVLVAVNQALATPDTPIADGDEVAFFPPVTGG